MKFFLRFVKNNFWFLLVFFLAVILRFHQLGYIPIGFNDDESAFGYNAYSILKTGRDEWGRLLPFPAFESFGDWKLVGYLYPVILSQTIFGVNEFATRFPSALVGVLSIISTYFLAKKFFDKKIALTASLLLAISPWHIIASRNAFESDILIFFISLATYFFIEGLEKKKFFTSSFILFGFSFYIYRSSWIFVPLFLVVLIFTYRERLLSKKPFLVKNLLVFFIFILPLLPTVLTFKGESRFFQESFIYGVSRVGIINEVNEKRGVCKENAPEIFCKVTYNRFVAFFSTYFKNYFENLSPQAYFTEGIPSGYQAFSNRGLFYLFEFPLLVVGIVLLLKRKNKSAAVLIFWILISPIGASFTGIGNPGRLNIVLPAFQIVEAFGLVSLLDLIKISIVRKLTVSIFLFLAIILVGSVWVEMFYYYPLISGRFQRYGYKQLFDYLEMHKGDYAQLAISRQGDDAKQYIHYLFYEKVDPNIFLSTSITGRFRGAGNWIHVENIGKLKFYAQTPQLDALPNKTLLAVREKEIKTEASPIFVVNYLNGDKAFEVYDVDQLKKVSQKENKEGL